MAQLRFLIPMCALLVLTGACGDDSTSSTTTTTSQSGSSTAAGDTKAFTDCLKKHGVDLPEGFGGGPGGGTSGGPPPEAGGAGTPPAGFDPAKMQEAQKACQSLAPEGGFGGAGGPGQGGGNAAYTSCLKDHGVDLPDPSAGTTGAPSSIPADDATFQAAQQACQSLLSTGGAGETSTTAAAS